MPNDVWGGAFGDQGSNPCANGVCGTGDWDGPKPGDPDNNILLSAVPAFGGIDLSWTYPNTNPEAVAHTIIYRSQSSLFGSAQAIAIHAGNTYFDKTPTATPVRQYYWVQLVSVYGTYGTPIGPASAIARSRIDQTIEELSGQINEGLLAQTLKSKIDNINTVGAQLNTEIQRRIAENAALGDAINGVSNDALKALTLVQQEITQRTEGDSALVNQVNVVATAVNKNYAAFLEQKTFQTDLNNSTAASLQYLITKVGENSAAILYEQNLRASNDSALSSSVQTLNSTVNGNSATGQVGLTTYVNTLNGKVTSIGALYTAKVDVNGLIGGFGVYNDGKTVEAGFDVDRFWIGKNANKIKPFIVENDIVYINEAAINKLTFSKLRADDGSFLVEGGKVKAKYLKVDEVMGGSFIGNGWPATPGANGFYLGAGGLLLGNPIPAPGKPQSYLQLTEKGEIYAPAFSINAAGKMTINQLDVIDTVNIRGNAVTQPIYSGLTNSTDSRNNVRFHHPNSKTAIYYLEAGQSVFVLSNFTCKQIGFHAVNLTICAVNSNGDRKLLYSGGFSFENFGNGSGSGMFTVESDPNSLFKTGFFSFAAYVENSSNDGFLEQVSNCNIVALGAKR